MFTPPTLVAIRRQIARSCIGRRGGGSLNVTARPSVSLFDLRRQPTAAYATPVFFRNQSMKLEGRSPRRDRGDGVQK